ncbi:MAG: hypothetical protein NC548_35455, partial [Lachnospiraceae bacterium]|nr:hypothetical protein [Lachnospiraceae bacterium]
MSRMYSSVLPIGNSNRKIAVLNYEPDTATEQIEIKQQHHIQVLDRSGSLTRDIDQLIENVKQTLECIPDGDYVSIIWFSSPGQC